MINRTEVIRLQFMPDVQRWEVQVLLYNDRAGGDLYVETDINGEYILGRCSDKIVVQGNIYTVSLTDKMKVESAALKAVKR